MVDFTLASFHADMSVHKHLSSIFLDTHGHISFFDVEHCYDKELLRAIKSTIGLAAYRRSKRWEVMGTEVGQVLIKDLVHEVMSFLDMETDDFYARNGKTTISRKISPVDEKCDCWVRGNWCVYRHPMLEPQVFIIECIVAKEDEKLRECAMDWSGGCHDCGLWSVGDEFSKVKMPKVHLTRKRYWNSPLKFRMPEDPSRWQPCVTSWRKPQVLVKMFSQETETVESIEPFM